jgi:hypothetical protein
MSLSNATASTATSLRWRARVTRDAIDSALSMDETDPNNNAMEMMGMNDHHHRQRRWYHRYCCPCCCNFFVGPSVSAAGLPDTRRNRFFLRLAFVVAAGTLSLYSLRQASRSWQHAVTVTLQLAVLVILVLQGLHDDGTSRMPLTEYRKQQAATRRQYQAVQEKNENMAHKIRLHQTALDRVGTVRQELALHANETTSIEALVCSTKDRQATRRDLVDACRRQLLQDVVSILLAAQPTMDWDKNPFVYASTIERIVWACKNARAMDKFDEKKFREYLVDDASGSSSSSEIHVIKLLKVVADQRWEFSPELLLRRPDPKPENVPGDKDRDKE